MGRLRVVGRYLCEFVGHDSRHAAGECHSRYFPKPDIFSLCLRNNDLNNSRRRSLICHRLERRVSPAKAKSSVVTMPILRADAKCSTFVHSAKKVYNVNLSISRSLFIILYIVFPFDIFLFWNLNLVTRFFSMLLLLLLRLWCLISRRNKRYQVSLFGRDRLWSRNQGTSIEYISL